MIILDDASQDGTRAVAESYAAGDGRIKLISHDENYGIYRLADTYNEALSEAEGHLVAILEGDDLWVRDKLEHQVPFFEDSEVVLSYGNRKVIDAKGNVLRHTDLHKIAGKDVLNNDPVGKKYFHYVFLKNLTPSETVVIRKRTLAEIGGIVKVNGCGTIDFPTFFLLAGKGKFAYIEKYLGYFRRHGKNASIGKIEEYKEAYITLTKRYGKDLKDVWTSVGIDPGAVPSMQADLLRKGREKRAVRNHLHRINEMMILGRWKEARKELVLHLGRRKPDLKYPVILAQYVLSFFRSNILKTRFPSI
jgi:glycosyltransferase involved in cell wall biosynthesis